MRFSDFSHFRLFLNSRFSAILHRPTHKITTFARFNFALALKCPKSAKNNVTRKFPLLQYITVPILWVLSTLLLQLSCWHMTKEMRGVPGLLHIYRSAYLRVMHDAQIACTHKMVHLAKKGWQHTIHVEK